VQKGTQWRDPFFLILIINTKGYYNATIAAASTKQYQYVYIMYET
jgi:hypothetical protein